MPLYMLSRPGMAPGIGLIVREKTEFHARNAARKYAKDSMLESVRRQAEKWLEEETKCIQLDIHGKEGIVGIGADSGGEPPEREGESNPARAWAARHGFVSG